MSIPIIHGRMNMGKDAFFKDDGGHGWYLQQRVCHLCFVPICPLEVTLNSNTHPALEGGNKVIPMENVEGGGQYATCVPLACISSCPPWMCLCQDGNSGNCIDSAEENHPARKFVKSLNEGIAEEILKALVSAQGMNNDINKVAPEPMATPQIVTMAARTSSQEVETMPGGVAKFVCTNPVLARASADVNDKLPDLEANTLAEGVQILASEEGDGKWLRCASEGPFKGFYFPFYDQKTQNLMTHRVFFFKKLAGNLTQDDLKQLELTAENPGFLTTDGGLGFNVADILKEARLEHLTDTFRSSVQNFDSEIAHVGTLEGFLGPASLAALQMKDLEQRRFVATVQKKIDEEKERLRAANEEDARLRAANEEDARLRAADEEVARLRAAHEEDARLRAAEAAQSLSKIPTPLEMLTEARLGSYHEALTKIGVESVEDLLEVDDEMLDEVGMKLIEKRRFEAVKSRAAGVGEQRQALAAETAEEAKRIAEEEEEARRIAAEEEARRIAAEEEARRIAAEEEARRIAAEEEEARRIAAEEEARRIAAEEEALRIAAEEEEARRIAEEEEARRIAAEEEARRIAAEEEEEARRSTAPSAADKGDWRALLAEHRLEGYADKIASLGVLSSEDLLEVVESDLDEMGMKKLEARRFEALQKSLK
ncbi:hypothetical protein NFJ02_16g24470 [Pycnococcus provasolii]